MYLIKKSSLCQERVLAVCCVTLIFISVKDLKLSCERNMSPGLQINISFNFSINLCIRVIITCVCVLWGSGRIGVCVCEESESVCGGVERERESGCV